MFICRTRPSVRNTCGSSEPQHAALNISTSCHLWLFSSPADYFHHISKDHNKNFQCTDNLYTQKLLCLKYFDSNHLTGGAPASWRPLHLSLPSNSFKNVMHFLTFVYFSFWFVALLVNNTYILIVKIRGFACDAIQLKFCECCRYTGVCTYCERRRCFKRNDSHHETSRSLRMY